MHVNDFIQTFAGERSLSLLRCMAVANGNTSLDSTSVTLQEAKRYIVTYDTDTDISDYHDWDAASSIANEAYNGNYSAAVGEVALNVAFIAAPAVLKKPARKAAAVLSPIAKKTGRAINNGLVVIGKTKPFRKIVQITREQTGRITKRIVKTSGHSLKRSSGPVNKYKSWFLSQRLAKTLLQKELDAIKKKGAIKLTATELMQLSENPKEYIRHFILAKTGDKKNFQEFFIRLAMGDKAQVKQLLDIQEIRKYVDNSIRHYSGGGGGCMSGY